MDASVDGHPPDCAPSSSSASHDPDSSRKVAELESRVAELESAGQAIVAERDRLADETRVLKSIITQLLSARASLEAEVNAASSTVAQLTAENQQAQETVARLTEENEKLALENAQLQAFAVQADAALRQALSGGGSGGGGPPGYFGDDNVAY